MIEIRISGKDTSEIIAGIVDVFYLAHDAQQDNIQKRLAKYFSLAAEKTVEEKQDALSDMSLSSVESNPPQMPQSQPAIHDVLTVVPTAAPPAFDRTQIAVACTGLIDSPQKGAFLDLLHGTFKVNALTELRDDQLNDFVIAIRQLGAQI